MLLPATEVRFRTVDTFEIAVPAAVSAILVLATKPLPMLGRLYTSPPVVPLLPSSLSSPRPTKGW